MTALRQELFALKEEMRSVSIYCFFAGRRVSCSMKMSPLLSTKSTDELYSAMTPMQCECYNLQECEIFLIFFSLMRG